MTDTIELPTPPAWGPELAAAFATAQGEMPDITKGRTANVGTYSYTYADLADVLGALRPIFAKNGLFITQNVVSRPGTVDVWTTLGHKSGQSIDFGPMSFPAGNTPQTAGSAVTYARRYALLAAVGLATEDDDGQQAATSAPQRQTQARPRGKRQEGPTESTGPAPAGVALAERVAALDSESAMYLQLKEMSRQSGRALKAPFFDADPAWAAQVAATLDGAA